MGNILLCLAIVFETTGTLFMKMSEGFTKVIPSIMMVVSYIICFAFLSYSLKYIEVGKAYAIWSGLGTFLITIIGVLVFKESITIAKVSGTGLIISGVILLNLSGIKH